MWRVFFLKQIIFVQLTFVYTVTEFSLNGYSPDQDHIHSLNKRKQAIIFRQRTGHYGLNKHMKRIGLVDM